MFIQIRASDPITYVRIELDDVVKVIVTKRDDGEIHFKDKTSFLVDANEAKRVIQIIQNLDREKYSDK